MEMIDRDWTYGTRRTAIANPSHVDYLGENAVSLRAVSHLAHLMAVDAKFSGSHIAR